MAYRCSIGKMVVKLMLVAKIGLAPQIFTRYHTGALSKTTKLENNKIYVCSKSRSLAKRRLDFAGGNKSRVKVGRITQKF